MFAHNTQTTAPNPQTTTDGKVEYDEQFCQADFETFVLKHTDLDWFEVHYEWASEAIYEARINHAVIIRAFSSAQSGSGRGRANGTDRIRFILIDSNTGLPLMDKAVQHNRVRQDNVRIWIEKSMETIQSLTESVSNHIDACPNCGGFLNQIPQSDENAMVCANWNDGNCDEGYYEPVSTHTSAPIMG
jgi:hypothetical protein